jgi:hypothetical protein
VATPRNQLACATLQLTTLLCFAHIEVGTSVKACIEADTMQSKAVECQLAKKSSSVFDLKKFNILHLNPKP